MITMKRMGVHFVEMIKKEKENFNVIFYDGDDDKYDDDLKK